MTTDIQLKIDEDIIDSGMISLETDDYKNADKDDLELYKPTADDPELIISVHRNTGKILYIELDCFTTKMKDVIIRLRDYPLPWTFSLHSLGIVEKPLDEVLLAVCEKYKDVKMEWE
ncbi:hypothetical protein LLG96_06050 [bacterium]|nr:hypothetical protein [bacterium]